jgi:ABC-type Fe3+/spermidine/putrescine transport system ATPase subunit
VLRDSLQGQVRRILQEVGVSAIYVTHDRDEAFAVADRLAFMDRGTIVQTGAPEAVFAAPRDEFVARTLGFDNILRGVVRSRGQYVEVDCEIGTIYAKPALVAAEAGSEVLLLVEDRGIELRPTTDAGEPDRNVLTATVAERSFRSGQYVVKLRIGGGLLSYRSAHAPVAEGQEVRVAIDPNAVRSLGTK